MKLWRASPKMIIHATDLTSDNDLACWWPWGDPVFSALPWKKYLIYILMSMARVNGLWQDINTTLIARFMGPISGPSGSGRTQKGPILAPWTLFSGNITNRFENCSTKEIRKLIQFTCHYPLLLKLVCISSLQNCHCFVPRCIAYVIKTLNICTKQRTSHIQTWYYAHMFKNVFCIRKWKCAR